MNHLRTLFVWSTAFPLVCLVGCCCALPQSNTGGATRNWKPFTSQTGNFRAMFPTDPTYSTSDDGKRHRYTSELRGGQLLFRASYRSNAELTTTPVESLQIATESLGATGVSIVPLDLSGHPGAEARYFTTEGPDKFRIRHRIYHVGDTSYQVIVIAESSHDADEEAIRFFDSFQLIAPPPP